MVKTAYSIVHAFLRKIIHQRKFHEVIRRQRSAIKIQRTFRRYLMRSEIHSYFLNKMAQTIQRRYRKFLSDMNANEARKNYFNFRLNEIRKKKYLLQIEKENLSTTGKSKHENESTEDKKPKVIIELPRPWEKKKNSYSQRQIDDKIADQINDLKWVRHSIIPKFLNHSLSNIQNRAAVREKDINYQDRLVNKTFYTIIGKAIHCFKGKEREIKQFFFHESTFRIFIIHESGISIICINSNISKNRNNSKKAQINEENEMKEDTVVYYPNEFRILDACIDKRSGRILILNCNWSISVLENCYITKARKIFGVPKPTLPQKKYILVDKFGNLWLTLTQKYNTVYLIDSLCFSVLKTFPNFSFYSNGKISTIHPIYTKTKPIGFFVTCNSLPQFYVFDDKEERISTFNDHSLFTPNFYVVSNYVFTYSNDKKINVYKRNINALNKIKEFEFNSIPTSISYIKGMSLLLVGLSDSTLRFITFSSETYNLTLPYSMLPKDLIKYAEDVIGEPKTTNFSNQYNCIKVKRLTSPPKQIFVSQFAQNSALIAVQQGENEMYTYWLNKKVRKVKCSSYDFIETPPIQMIPTLIAKRKAETDFYAIYEEIIKTRKQLNLDGNFLKEVGSEFEKRFLSTKFMRKTTENAVSILFQSPFHRWLRWIDLYFAKDRISIYEVFYLVSKFDIFVPSLNTVESLNMFLIEAMPFIAASPVGPFATTLGTTFSVNELVNGFDILHSVIGAQFAYFQILKTAVLSLELTIPSIQLKTVIRDFNEYAILRLTEIENLARNKHRAAMLAHSVEEMLGSDPDQSKSKKKVTFSDYNNNSINSAITASSLPKIYKMPNIMMESIAPQLVPKLLKKSSFVMPDPLFESFRRRHKREQKSEYFAYGNECPAAELITFNKSFKNIDEILLARPLAKHGMALDVLAISKDGKQILKEYPINFVSLEYILTYNQFKCGLGRTVKTALFWLSRVLFILCSLHKSHFIARSLLPENILVSNDGKIVKLFSLSEFTTAKMNKKQMKKKVSYEKPDSPWLPPEYWSQMKDTPAFDVYQFGILMVVMLTGFIPSSFGEIIAKHKKFHPNIDALDIANSPNFFYDPLNGFPYADFQFFSAKNIELESLYQISSKSSLLDIAVACLDINPARRPTAKQLLNLPFFNFSNKRSMKSAQNIGFSLIRKMDLSIFTDSIFKELSRKIEKEIKEDPINIPTLETAVDILNYFINKNASGIRGDFPVDETRIGEIVDFIFSNNIFDKIVDYVVGRLQLRFEWQSDIQNDEPFNKMINLFQLSKGNSDVAKPFYYFCTGVRGNIDSHRLFCFLHKNLRKAVDQFFKSSTKEIRNVLGISEFYSAHFMQFYDNSRDFAEAYTEQSEKRHSAALNYFITFIDNFPTEETMKLLIDFRIQHKIEQSLCFSVPNVRLSALKLCSRVFSLKACFDNRFFDGFLFHSFPYYLLSDSQPYEEKMLMICVVRDVFFSTSVPAIISLLSSGILSALIDISLPKNDRFSNDIWGENTEFPIFVAVRDFLIELCERGITSVISVIYTDDDLVADCLRLNIPIQDTHTKDFDKMINKLKSNDFVEESLITTLKIAETSSFATIAAVTRQSKQCFEDSLREICNFIIKQEEKRYIHDNLFQSVLKIYEYHKIEIFEPMIVAIIKGMEKDYEGHIEMGIEILKILSKMKLPPIYSDIPKIWFEKMTLNFNDIKKMIKSQTVDMDILTKYRVERSQRLRFLTTFLSHSDQGIIVEFVTQCNFSNLLFDSLLFDDSKFEIKSRVVPPSFAKYNNTYAIRNEGIDFLKILVKHRVNCHMLFHMVSKNMKDKDILKREAQSLKRINDHDFRKSSLRFLGVINDENDAFGLNKDIVECEAMKILKEIALEQWEDFEIKRGLMSMDEMKKNSKILGDVKNLYDSIS